MIRSFSITDIGRKRKLNQDYVYTSEQQVGHLPNLFLVADGMGGHKAGDYASRCAIETITQYISESDENSAVGVIGRAIQKANEEIKRHSDTEEELQGMGTTIVAASIKGNELCVANVGDSRLYIAGSKGIRQVTIDHSLVEEMVRKGGIRPEQARLHPDKNIITRALGVMDEVDIDFFKVELRPGDIVLMCSDGLSNMIEDEEIRMILKGRRSLHEKGESLVEAANNNGGKDNIAVVLVEPVWE